MLAESVVGGVVDSVTLVGSTASRVGKSVGRLSVARLVDVTVSARWTVASGVCVAVAEGVTSVCVASEVADAMALVGSTASRDGKSVGRLSVARLVGVTDSARWTVAFGVCVAVAEGVASVCVASEVADAVALVGSLASRDGKSVRRLSVARLVDVQSARAGLSLLASESRSPRA